MESESGMKSSDWNPPTRKCSTMVQLDATNWFAEDYIIYDGFPANQQVKRIVETDVGIVQIFWVDFR